MPQPVGSSESGGVVVVDNSFEMRVKALAYQSDLRVAEASASGAKLKFSFTKEPPDTTQVVWIIPFGDTWEFSCLSFIKERDPKKIPSILLIYALQQNAKNRRGSWTLNHYSDSGNYVLEYMANIDGSIVTPDEFNKTCWAVATAVDKLEKMLRKL